MNSEDFAQKMSEFGLDGSGVEPPDFGSLLHQMDRGPESEAELDAIAARVEAEQSRYREALTALEVGNYEEAEALLLQCAESGTGEADYLLADLLSKQERDKEAYVWYLQAAEQGDPRAFEALKQKIPSGHAGDEIFFPRVETDAWKIYLCAPLGSGKTSHWVFYSLPRLDLFSIPVFPRWNRFALPEILGLVRSLNVIGHGPQASRLEELVANLVTSWESSMRAEACSRRFLRSAVALDACSSYVVEEIQNPRRMEPLLLPYGFSETKHVEEKVGLKAFGCRVGGAVILDRRRAFEEVDEQKRGFAYDAMVPRESLPSLHMYDTMNDALEVFLEHGFRALPVEKEGTPIGCIRMKDVVRKSLSSGTPSIARLEEMIHPFTFVRSSASAEDVLRHISGTDDLVAVLGRGSSPIGYINSESLLSNAKRLAQESRNVIPMRKKEDPRTPHPGVEDRVSRGQVLPRHKENELAFSSRFA